MENEISVAELMEFFEDTLAKCGGFLLEQSDAEIEYNIFEEFDVGAVSFLHEDSLRRLKNAGLITDDILQKSLQLRKAYLALDNTDLMDAASVRNSPEWRKILLLADEIKILMSRND